MTHGARADYCEVILDLIGKAGRMALDLIDHSVPELKVDSSVITEADRRISALAHEYLRPYLDSGEHVLVDEEDPLRAELLQNGKLATTRYIWAIDPIDATRAYANRMPHYGISLGLIKDQRPWLGAVLFPSLGELYFCDGEKAFFIRNAFTEREFRSGIVALDELITSRSVFICTDELMGQFDWNPVDCRIMVFGSAVCEFCWPAVGRGCGSLSRVYLWDMAGSWPVFEKAGLKMYSIRTGQQLERLSADLFYHDDQPWRFKDHFILSSPRNFEILRARLIPRGKGPYDH